MRAIVLSAMSDIGIELVKSLKSKNYEVFGTYNSSNPDYSLISKNNWLKLNIKDFNSFEYKSWLSNINEWDLFISLVGSQEPIGLFEDTNPDEWVKGVQNNSTYQIAALMMALPYRKTKGISNAIFFAGSGTNSATPNYSAYTLGKITLIKAVELLDAELKNLKVTILGPGWVKTKIHNSTLRANINAGENYQKTRKMMDSPERNNPISKVIKDVHKLILLPKSLVGGRNFSSVNDLLTETNLKRLKQKNNDFYRLRRSANNI